MNAKDVSCIITEMNGASFTLDINDIGYPETTAVEDVAKIIEEMELEKVNIIPSFSRITVRVKGKHEKIEDFFQRLLAMEKFCVRRKSLSL